MEESGKKAVKEEFSIISDEYYDKKMSVLKIRQWLLSMLTWIFLILNMLVILWETFYEWFPVTVNEPFYYQQNHVYLLFDLVSFTEQLLFIVIVMVVIFSYTTGCYSKKKIEKAYPVFDEKQLSVTVIEASMDCQYTNHSKQDKFIRIKPEENVLNQELKDLTSVSDEDLTSSD